MLTVYQWKTKTGVGHASLGITNPDNYISFHPLTDDTTGMGGFLGSVLSAGARLALGKPDFTDLEDDHSKGKLVNSIKINGLDESIADELIDDFKYDATNYNLLAQNCSTVVAKVLLVASHKKKANLRNIVSSIPLNNAAKRSISDALDSAQKGAYPDALFDLASDSFGAKIYHSNRHRNDKFGKVLKGAGGVLIAASMLSNATWTPESVINLAKKIRS